MDFSRVYAGNAREIQRLCGVVSVNAPCAMTAPETTMTLEALYACCHALDTSAWATTPTIQVQVAPEPGIMTGLSVNRYAATVTRQDCDRDGLKAARGVNESAEKSRLFVRTMRI